MLNSFIIIDKVDKLLCAVNPSNQLYFNLGGLLHDRVLLLLFLVFDYEAEFVYVLQWSLLERVGFASAIQHDAFHLEQSAP